MSCASAEPATSINESTVDIWDITDTAAPVRLSRTGYPNAAYVHSGWWSEDVVRRIFDTVEVP